MFQTRVREHKKDITVLGFGHFCDVMKCK